MSGSRCGTKILLTELEIFKMQSVPKVINAEFRDISKRCRFRKRYPRKTNSQQYNNKYSHNPGYGKKKVENQGMVIHPVSGFLMLSGLAILIGTLIFGDFLKHGDEINALQSTHQYLPNCGK